MHQTLCRGHHDVDLSHPHLVGRLFCDDQLGGSRTRNQRHTCSRVIYCHCLCRISSGRSSIDEIVRSTRCSFECAGSPPTPLRTHERKRPDTYEMKKARMILRAFFVSEIAYSSLPTRAIHQRRCSSVLQETRRQTREEFAYCLGFIATNDENRTLRPSQHALGSTTK